MAPRPGARATCGGGAPDRAGPRALFGDSSPGRAATGGHAAIPTGRIATPVERAGTPIDGPAMRDRDVARRDDRPARWPALWPALWPCPQVAGILIAGMPVGPGADSPVRRLPVERRHGMSGELDDEDGVEPAAMTDPCARSQPGCTIPPRADRGRIGEAGPGPSHGDYGPDGPVGFDDDSTPRDATILAWNAMHPAAMLADGIATHGNDRRVSPVEGRDPSLPNPEYRS